MKDPVVGAGQLLAHATPQFFDESYVDPDVMMMTGKAPTPGPSSKEVASRVDKEVQDREATIRAGEPEGRDWARLGGNLASGLANPLNFVPGVGPVVKGMMIGAGAGMAEPVTEGDYATEKAKQVAIGAGLGAGTGVVAKAIGAIAPKVMPSVESATGAAMKAPTTAADAKTIASNFYRQASDAGGELTPQFTNDFLDEAGKLAPQTAAGKIVRGDTPLTSLLDRMQGLRDQPISLQSAQEIDEGLGNLIDTEYGVKGLSKEGKQILDLQTKFREKIAGASPADTTGDMQGFNALKDARGAYSQAMKMSDLERIQQRADLMENPSTGIRSGIRTLLSSKPKSRGYTDEEITALKNAAERGGIGSTLQILGSRLIPIAAAAAGHLPGAVASHGLSSGMRAGASALQGRRLQGAMNVLGARVPGAYTPSPWLGAARSAIGNAARQGLPYSAPAAPDYLNQPQGGFGPLVQ